MRATALLPRLIGLDRIRVLGAEFVRLRCRARGAPAALVVLLDEQEGPRAFVEASLGLVPDRRTKATVEQVLSDAVDEK